MFIDLLSYLVRKVQGNSEWQSDLKPYSKFLYRETKSIRTWGKKKYETIKIIRTDYI